MKRIFVASLIILNMLSITAFADSVEQNSQTSSISTTFIADKPITITINGEEIENDTSPVIIDNSVLVPLRAVTEKLGVNVGWNPKNRQIKLSGDNQVIEMFIKRISVELTEWIQK